MNKRTIITNYLAIATFILGWWFFSFNHSADSKMTPSTLSKDDQSPPELQFSHYKNLFSIDKNLLKTALAGDFDLMSELILKWEVDAQILLADGLKSIKRLSEFEFLRSQVLTRTIQSSKNTGKTKKIRFLPQTFAAASILLSLVSPDQIVALPKNLRKQELLFPKIITDKIPLDIDRYHREKLFLAKPDIAFVAEYSHPATLQALQDQGVTLYMMKELTTFESLQKELMNLGEITNRTHQAELLKIFIHAALIALDNRQQLIVNSFNETKTLLPTILVLDYHNMFSIPSFKTLNGKIVDRLKTNQSVEQKKKIQNFSSVSIEQLVQLNPSCLIVITDKEIGLENEIQKNPALSLLSAVKNGNVFILDDALHHSPTQYIILAYHELVEILEKLL